MEPLRAKWDLHYSEWIYQADSSTYEDWSANLPGWLCIWRLICESTGLTLHMKIDLRIYRADSSTYEDWSGNLSGWLFYIWRLICESTRLTLLHMKTDLRIYRADSSTYVDWSANPQLISITLWMYVNMWTYVPWFSLLYESVWKDLVGDISS